MREGSALRSLFSRFVFFLVKVWGKLWYPKSRQRLCVLPAQHLLPSLAGARLGFSCGELALCHGVLAEYRRLHPISRGGHVTQAGQSGTFIPWPPRFVGMACDSSRASQNLPKRLGSGGNNSLFLWDLQLCQRTSLPVPPGTGLQSEATVARTAEPRAGDRPPYGDDLFEPLDSNGSETR